MVKVRLNRAGFAALSVPRKSSYLLEACLLGTHLIIPTSQPCLSQAYVHVALLHTVTALTQGQTFVSS